MAVTMKRAAYADMFGPPSVRRLLGTKAKSHFPVRLHSSPPQSAPAQPFTCN